jgi:hypothetical protein
MSDAALTSAAGVSLPLRTHFQIPVVALGMSLGTFLVLTYLLCIVFDLWFPESAMNTIWRPLLPGFTWLTWSGFFIGLVETFAYGWYIALIFAPLYNFFVRRC